MEKEYYIVPENLDYNFSVVANNLADAYWQAQERLDKLEVPGMFDITGAQERINFTWN
jgi:hypothetical protein